MIQNRGLLRALLFVKCASAMASPVDAQGVYVEAAENGRGITWAHRDNPDQCYVLTPYHLVNTVARIEFTRKRSRKAPGGDVFQIGALGPDSNGRSSDLALVEVGGSDPTSFCEESWSVPEQLDRLLQETDGTTGVELRVPGAVGNIRRMEVRIAGHDQNEVHIVLPDHRQEWRGTLSGSGLYLRGQLVGMLLGKTPSGEGRVYRIDRIAALAVIIIGPVGGSGPALTGALTRWILAGAGVTAGLAWRQDRNLASRRRALLDFPQDENLVADDVEFNRLLDQAHGVRRNRDIFLWSSVALGGVAIGGYLIESAFGRRSSWQWGTWHWSAGIDSANKSVYVTASF